jgi:hypothetical protein
MCMPWFSVLTSTSRMVIPIYLLRDCVRAIRFRRWPGGRADRGRERVDGPGRGLPLLWRTQAARNTVGTATMPSTTMTSRWRGTARSGRRVPRRHVRRRRRSAPWRALAARQGRRCPRSLPRRPRTGASRHGVPLISEIWKVGIIDGTSVSHPICVKDLNEDDESGR